MINDVLHTICFLEDRGASNNKIDSAWQLLRESTSYIENKEAKQSQILSVVVEEALDKA